MQVQIIGAGAFFLFVFLSGYRLKRSGAPYGMLVLTAHKLIALAAAALLVVAIYQDHQIAQIGLVEWGAVLVTAVFFIGTVATGGLMSTGKAMPAIVSRFHNITPFLTVVASAVTVSLFLAESTGYLSLVQR